MSTLVLRYSEYRFQNLPLKFLAAVLCAVFFGPGTAFAQQEGARSEIDVSQAKPSEEVALTYKDMIRDERRLLDRSKYVEKIVSGFAALGIGVYGYYFDRQNIGRQLAYSATQTAGVFMISNSLLEGEAPSLLLETDKYLKINRELTYSEYKDVVVQVDHFKKRAAYKQVAYSAGILSALYSINSFQERDRSLTLRNVYGFLSVNFAVISGVGFWQLNHMNQKIFTRISYGILPEMFIAFHF